MPLSTFEASLSATRPDWRVDPLWYALTEDERHLLDERNIGRLTSLEQIRVPAGSAIFGNVPDPTGGGPLPSGAHQGLDEDRMSVVLLGGNRFEDCRSILAYKGEPMLQILFDPLRVQLATPQDGSSRPAVRVEEARAPGGDTRVVATPSAFAIFWKDYAISLAILCDTAVAYLKLDLRPLGIMIFDDMEGLHIGSNVFARNVVSHAAVAINLGD